MPSGGSNPRRRPERLLDRCDWRAHNVVLVHMAGMGKKEAATAATNCRATFPGIRLAMVIGVCGVVPRSADGDIVLGDGVISEGVVPV